MGSDNKQGNDTYLMPDGVKPSEKIMCKVRRLAGVWWGDRLWFSVGWSAKASCLKPAPSERRTSQTRDSECRDLKSRTFQMCWRGRVGKRLRSSGKWEGGWENEMHFVYVLSEFYKLHKLFDLSNSRELMIIFLCSGWRNWDSTQLRHLPKAT